MQKLLSEKVIKIALFDFSFATNKNNLWKSDIT